MAYVDGFVLPIPKENIEAYRDVAQAAGTVWMDHGALEYWECVGEDLEPEEVKTTFPDMADVKEDETVVFSWIVYESREHRDEVLEKVMADPRLKEVEKELFEYQRMAYGGFETLVRY